MPTPMIWLANIFTLVSLFWVFEAYANSRFACYSIYQASGFDTESNRRGYYKFLDQFAQKYTEPIGGISNNSQKEPMPISKDLSNDMSPKKLLDVTSMGVLGDVFDLISEASSSKPILQVIPWRFSAVKSETEKLLLQTPSVIPQRILDLIDNSVEVRELSDNVILITAKLVSFKHLTGLAQAVLHSFQRVGMSTVTFVYRKSGLEPNQTIIGFTMLDEVVQVLSQQRGYSIHMAYDKSVWQMQTRVIAARVLQYENAKSEIERKRVIDLLNQGRDSFLPFAGVVSTEWVVPNSSPIELKRYFSNEFEDPLGLVATSKKDEFRLRHQMLYQVISGLPEQSKLEVHAHSVLHKKAYIKLGFFEEREDVNPMYPGVKVFILKGERENVLIKIKSILDKSQ